MPYFIETYDEPDHRSLRQRVRPAHLQYLEMNKNKLLASGAKLDDAGENASGGVYILDTDSRGQHRVGNDRKLLLYGSADSLGHRSHARGRAWRCLRNELTGLSPGALVYSLSRVPTIAAGL
jgi:uncharacterized protein YciI